MKSRSSSSSKQNMPREFGRYKVSSLLGEGAMGRVYLATDPVLDRQVAIKVITIDSVTDNRTREEYLGRFGVEAKASARLSHPSIVTIFDAGEQDGIPWIAFEYVDGEPLQHFLDQKDLIPVEKAVATTIDIAAALHHAHETGIIHRDIKPANILIDKRTGIAKLADFGVVKAPWVALTQDGNTVGSPGYISPEQLEGKGSDKRSDLFSLGIVLYQMLSGKHPFMRPTISATIFATLHGTYTPLEELRADCPPYLVKIIRTLLQNDPAKRFQTAAILLHELRTGSRPPQGPQTLDKNAFLGNTTRFHRVTHMLKQKLEQDRNSPQSLSAFISKAYLYCKNISTQHFSPSRRGATFFLMSGVVALLFILSLFMLRTADERRVAKILHQHGYTGSIPKIIDSCSAMIACSTFTPVYTVAENILGSSRYRPYGHLLTARAALNEGDDTKAVRALSLIVNDKEWPSIKKEARQPLMADCTKRLTAKKADSLLLKTLATSVLDNQDETIISWMEQPSYWLRWNGVRLASRLSVTVDSVKVYMLDLEYGGSISTRTHAATRLGELGDKRAVAVLEKAANRGIRDPIVSFKADAVLRNHFAKK